MSRASGFNSPLLLGFEHLERLLDHVSKGATEGYPPYNIERIGANRLRITLAVAGFSLDELSITVEDGQLIVRGRRMEDDTGRVFLHRGIAARQFQRSYVLADGIEVVEATLDNGMLNIDLERPMPEVDVRTIPIAKRKAAAAATPQTMILAGACRTPIR